MEKRRTFPNKQMDNTAMIFLGMAGVFFVVGVVMLFANSKDKGKQPQIDADYKNKLRQVYFEKGSIEETFIYLQDEYEDDKYMSGLLEKTVKYLNGEYGDYETALNIMNASDDEELKKVNEEILQTEIRKHWALPMK